LLSAYHDNEWGVPVTDERGLFERLSLEAFQSGLSWRTVLARRPAFRAAFAGFDPEVVAGFGVEDTRRLLADPGIIRNARKVAAVASNARAVLRLRDEGGLSRLVWSHRPPPRSRPLASLADVPAATPESHALAERLRRAGFVFVGPVTGYATMQACGLVNDHVTGCPRWEVVRRVTDPTPGR
jgi:DNA-3-methyladenine glycosylase I